MLPLQAQDRSLEIFDAGQPREFSAVTDAWETGPGKAGRVEKIFSLGSLGELESAALRHEWATRSPARILLYERGVKRTPHNRRTVTDRIIVQLAPGVSRSWLLRKINAAPVETTRLPEGYYVVRIKRAAHTLSRVERLRKSPGVLRADPMLRRLQTKRFTPNDTYFTAQWHLKNTGTGGATADMDVNVSPAWDVIVSGTVVRGSGVRIAIIDDGIQVNHPDLITNVDTDNDFNWNNGSSSDPSSQQSNGDFHGNACAGVAAGRGNNGLGISGAAPQATLVGLRLIAGTVADTQEGAALDWKSNIVQVKSNSWGPDDDGATLEGPGTVAAAALVNATGTGRGGLGSIIVWAAGNGLKSNDNSNYDGYANSIYTIAVGAVNDRGIQSYYSEPGANIVVTAPSNDTSARKGIVTTDLTGINGYNFDGTNEFSLPNIPDLNYTNDFGGTSSACPLVAGVTALILQAKPTLGWRDVQEILIRSAKKNQPADTDWINNGAGFHFNHKYGAGLVDAHAAVLMSGTWTNLGPQLKISATNSTSTTIVDNNNTGVTRSFTLSAINSLRVEHVNVKVNISHSSRGDLAVTLTSPAGTVSRLAEVHADTGNNYANWTFMSVRHWGENSAGTWTVKVSDGTAGTAGTLSLVELTVFGTTGNAAPTVNSATILPGTTAFSDETLSVTGVATSDLENNPVTVAYQWESSTDGVAFAPVAIATNSSVSAALSNSGKAWRCKLTPNDGNQNGSPFTSGTVTVNQRPVVLGQSGSLYSYDSDLVLAKGSGTSGFLVPVFINEFSQGISNTNREWVELLTTQTTDLRGYSVQDSNPTALTFSSGTFWSAIPAGTLIVIYNGTARDTVLPADDTNASDGNLILPHNNATYFSGTWPALTNSDDAIIVRNASAISIDGVSYGGNTTQQPSLGEVSGGLSANFSGSTELQLSAPASWTTVGYLSATPGQPNSTANTGLVTSLRSLGGSANFRFANASELVPGLTITSTNGLVSGTIATNAPGLYHLIIERTNGSATVSQQYNLLVGSTNGVFTIPPGKTWTLLANTTIAGTILNSGTIQTNGFLLSNTQSFTSWTAAYLPNTSPAPASDNDNDLLPHRIEYGIGARPDRYDANLGPTAVLSGTNIVVQFQRDLTAGGTRVEVQQSTDFVTWTPVSDVLTSSSNTIELRTAIVPMGSGTSKFIRLFAP